MLVEASTVGISEATFSERAFWKEGLPVPARPAWANEAAGLAAAALDARVSQTQTESTGSEIQESTLIAQPLPAGTEGRVVILELPTTAPAAVALARERLEISSRLWTQRAGEDTDGSLQTVFELQERLVHQQGFAATAEALCSGLADVLGASRVVLGTSGWSGVRLRAINHRTEIERGGEAARQLEEALQACVSQNLELASPSFGELEDAPGLKLCRTDDSEILALPLRLLGEVRGAVLIQQPAGHGQREAQLALLRLLLDLCAPLLLERERADRPWRERLADAHRDARRALAEPQGSSRKLLGVAAVVAALFLLVPVSFSVEAPFVVQASEKRLVTAPFDGQLATSERQPGDAVVAGETVLAVMDTEELELEWGRAQAEYLQAVKQADAARTAGRPGDEQIAMYDAEQARAAMELHQARIAQATLISPVTGVILEGDLRRRLGSPVARGERLVEVAPLDALEAEVEVPEGLIRHVEAGHQGWLRSAARPQDTIPIRVKRVNPLAVVRDHRNVFPVVVEVIEDEARTAQHGVMPGMRGVARIEVGRASRLWQWTREAIAYARLHLWF